MGKRYISKVSKRSAHIASVAQTPNLEPEKPSYREIKRRSIIAGLRMMRAPAVSWPSGWVDLEELIGLNSSLVSFPKFDY